MPSQKRKETRRWKLLQKANKNCLSIKAFEINYSIFQTTRFNHTMIFFKLTD